MFKVDGSGRLQEYGAFTFQGCEGAYGLCPKSRARRARPSPSKVYPAAKLHWHFTYGFDFRHSLWLSFVGGFAVLKGLKIYPEVFEKGAVDVKKLMKNQPFVSDGPL